MLFFRFFWYVSAFSSSMFIRVCVLLPHRLSLVSLFILACIVESLCADPKDTFDTLYLVNVFWCFLVMNISIIDDFSLCRNVGSCFSFLIISSESVRRMSLSSVP